MDELQLGPNGSLTYWMEFLETNFEWLESKIQSLIQMNTSKAENDEFSNATCPYLIFDLPGQVELYTNHYSLRNVIQKLMKNINWNLAAIHIIDGIWLTDTSWNKTCHF